MVKLTPVPVSKELWIEATTQEVIPMDIRSLLVGLAQMVSSAYSKLYESLALPVATSVVCRSVNLAERRWFTVVSGCGCDNSVFRSDFSVREDTIHYLVGKGVLVQDESL